MSTTHTPAEQAARLIRQWEAEAANARDERAKVARIRGVSTLRQYERQRMEEGDGQEPYIVEGREIVEREEGSYGC